jgi:hypothetical protein
MQEILKIQLIKEQAKVIKYIIHFNKCFTGIRNFNW